MDRHLPAHMLRRASVALAGLVCGMLCATIVSGLSAPAARATEMLVAIAI